MLSTVLTALALLASAVAHALPVIGVLGRPGLARLYGVTIDDPAVLLLMRHRAVLFGLVGALAMVAVFVPVLQIAALSVSAMSTAGYVVLWRGTGRAGGAPLARVARVDLVLAALSVIALGVRVAAG